MTKPPSSAGGRKPVPIEQNRPTGRAASSSATTTTATTAAAASRRAIRPIRAIEPASCVLRRLAPWRRAPTAPAAAPRVTDSTSESSTATERLSDSARKNWPGTPESRPSGANTTTVVSVELTSGAISCGHRVDDAARAFVGAAMNVLDHHHRIVDDQADGDGEAAHRHQVDGAAEEPHEDEGRDHGERQRDRGDQRQPPVAQEDEQHDDREQAADQDRVAHAGDRVADELGEVVDLG